MKPTKIIERRYITRGQARKMCIHQDWYDMGTNEEYEAMFNKFCGKDKKLTTRNIWNMAMDIINHTSEYDSVESMMMTIANYATSEFELSFSLGSTF